MESDTKDSTLLTRQRQKIQDKQIEEINKIVWRKKQRKGVQKQERNRK